MSTTTDPPTVTQADLAAGLRAVGLAAGDTVLVHSSLSAFGHVVGGADAVLDALLAVLGPGGTLVLPTFTWGAFHQADEALFDVLATPCETGRVPETFRRRPGVLRGEHLCHSMAACGPHALAALGDGVRSFGDGSPFDVLYQLDAWNLLLGVTFQSCTALHAAEERCQVPYRAYRDYPRAQVRRADGSLVPSPAVEFLRQDGSSNDFAKLEAHFDAEGLLRTTQVGNARVINARVRAIIDSACRLLGEDVYALSRRA